jgi:quercetin dioxygenase-like cupin family protein
MPRFITAADVLHEDYPWCHVEVMSSPETTEAKHLIQVRATFPPGQMHKFHHHPGREEIIYVLSGQAKQWVGEAWRLLQAGEMAHIPPGVVHMTLNPGPEPLVFLAILSPVEDSQPFTVDVFDQSPWSEITASLV